MAGVLLGVAAPLHGEGLETLASQRDRVADLTDSLAATPLQAGFKAVQTRRASLRPAPDGQPLPAAEQQFTYIVRQLGEDYLVERYVQDSLQARLAKRGSEYKAETYTDSTGETLMEQTGPAARSLVAAHFLPASHAQGILRVYDRLDAEPNDPALSLRSTDEGTVLEEHMVQPGPLEGRLVARWAVLEEGILMRRETGDDSAPASSRYEGRQDFEGFPFPRSITWDTRDRDGNLTHRREITGITLSRADEDAFRRDLDAFFE